MADEESSAEPEDRYSEFPFYKGDERIARLIGVGREKFSGLARGIP